jgi:hypothetical protein
LEYLASIVLQSGKTGRIDRQTRRADKSYRWWATEA